MSLSQKRKSSGGLTSRGIPASPPPKTVLSSPYTPPQVWERVAESNSAAELRPGSGDPAAAVWHRPTPSPRSPTFSVAAPFPAPDPAAWSRDERVTSSSPAAARARATRSHNLTDWSREPGPGRQTRARLSGSRSSSPPPLSEPPGAAPETRRSALASRAAGGVCSGADRSVLGGENERGDSAWAGAVLRPASAARLIVPGGSPLPAPAQSLRRAPPRASQRPPLAPAPPPPRLPPASPSLPRSPSGRQLAREVPATTPYCRAPLPGLRRKGYKVGAPGCEPSPAGGTE